jgi:hypothetical protein
MATSAVVMSRATASLTTTTTLYTVPAGRSAVITNIVVANTAATSGTFTIAIDGVAIATTVAIAANSIAAFDMKQVLAATKTITGGASATTINFHISGVEIY